MGTALKVQVTDGFWLAYQRLIRETVIPYQWEILNDRIEVAEPSGAVHNFKVAAGLEEGGFKGLVFQDSDLAKWIEAAGYSLKSLRDPELEKKVDEIIGYIEKAQRPDGYINAYFIINGLDKRFTNLQDCHELYCLGHLTEAAVSYYEATGKRELLDVARRGCDLVCGLFGPADDQIHGYPGHQEIELALVKLYHATGENKYLDLARYFIDERGKTPNFFIQEWEKRGKTGYWTHGPINAPDLKYYQAHMPVREQKVAVGHAVRQLYMLTGMAAIARETGEAALADACRAMWGDITNRQMYITGGVGQTSIGEAFTFDYDLPADTMYSETCASIALIFFARNMLDVEVKSTYADVMERALYNTVLASMAMDGRHFFYVNPLEVWPEASAEAPIRRHVLAKRPAWFGCACCPPNVARLIASLDKYMYSADGRGIYVHLYGSSDASFTMDGGIVSLKQVTDYPWDGGVQITVDANGVSEFSVALRLPDWCEKPEISINNEKVTELGIKDGYAYLKRKWGRGDKIDLNLPMRAKLMRSDTRARANAGKVCVMRGPIVYCVESIDNGENLSELIIDKNAPLNEKRAESELGPYVAVKARGFRETAAGQSLYFPFESKLEETELAFIPYYMWGNRDECEMSVWVRITISSLAAR